MSTERPDDTPKRLRAADVIDAQQAALMAALTRTSGQGATVEISRNAKGEYQFGVKVSDDNPTAALETAKALAVALEELYPYGAEPKATT